MTKSLSFLAARVLLAAAITAPTQALADNADAQLIELKRRLQERDAEIECLRGLIKAFREQGGTLLARADCRLTESVAQGAALQASGSGQQARDSDEDAGALERALVLEGGGVLAPGQVEVVPELSFVHQDSVGGARRDTLGSAITTRLGLPWLMQGDVTVPFVIRDHWRTYGNSSGIGDVRLGLTKQLVGGHARTVALFLRGEWRLPTGSARKVPPTGFGQHGAQIELTATKQDDPVVLFGNLSYRWNLGTTRLGGGVTLDSGDIYGGRLGALLAATSDTSLLAAFALYASDEDRVSGRSIGEPGRVLGSLELGVATILARNLFLDTNATLGFTRAAPDFTLFVSLPYRF
jgi:hypothetical protein